MPATRVIEWQGVHIGVQGKGEPHRATRKQVIASMLDPNVAGEGACTFVWLDGVLGVGRS